MRLHRNAKTTPKMRELMVRRVQQGWTQQQVATAAGVSVRTVAKWVARARQGVGALEDGSSRPRRQPRRLEVTRTTAILAWRQTRATAWEISHRTGVPRSTVTKVLQRAGLQRVAHLEPPRPVQRYEWAQAGDLLHLDIKPLGRIRGVGHRIHGDRAQRARGVGYEYVHVAIDDATRVGVYGNAGRGLISGPAYVSTDFSVIKDFNLRESTRLQVRSEFFNAFNQVNFSNPSSRVTSGSFGRIRSAAEGRVIQFALKFIW